LSFDLSGPLVQQALALFERDWAFANTERAPQEMPPEEGVDTAPAHGAQLVASGPDQVDDTVYALLLTAAYQARRRIALVTPYFVPDSALLMALCLAARRGVLVELLIPARSNHRLSDIARGRALRALAQAGARVWLAPQMLHAKLAVIDDQLALAGSANIDSRNLFLNYELMVAFHRAMTCASSAHGSNASVRRRRGQRAQARAGARCGRAWCVGRLQL
jgi:cardiolipin synthase